MKIGVSTSCLYPTITENALGNLLEQGVSNIEIFFNTSCELERSFVKGLKRQVRHYGAKVRSLHPYSSMMEPFMFFSNYERRFTDMIDDYQRYFEAAKILGADLVVIHGDKLPAQTPDEKYFERFARIIEVGKRFDVIVAQENVNLHRSQNTDFLMKMMSWIGSDIKFVYDIKQAIRAGYDPYTFAEKIGSSIIHVHVSDNAPNNTCMLPGKGIMDYARLKSILDAAGSDASWVVEIYRSNFDKPSELVESAKWLAKVTNSDF